MSLNGYERETIVSMNDADDTAFIYTAQRKLITRLKHNKAAILVSEGKFDDSVWAKFVIPAAFVSFRSVRPHHEQSKEQQEASAARMRQMNERKYRSGVRDGWPSCIG